MAGATDFGQDTWMVRPGDASMRLSVGIGSARGAGDNESGHEVEVYSPNGTRIFGCSRSCDLTYANITPGRWMAWISSGQDVTFRVAATRGPAFGTETLYDVPDYRPGATDRFLVDEGVTRITLHASPLGLREPAGLAPILDLVAPSGESRPCRAPCTLEVAAPAAGLWSIEYAGAGLVSGPVRVTVEQRAET